MNLLPSLLLLLLRSPSPPPLQHSALHALGSFNLGFSAMRAQACAIEGLVAAVWCFDPDRPVTCGSQSVQSVPLEAQAAQA
ncbi:hypothetical protein GGR56DRAFT_614306 [Xylariaceae sp. FL0804]|nr:hypothetical protein GGR56DRAFT_614306 [Xylariaceae sp. FL0804]